MKPLLIGQAPGPNTDPDLPLFPLPRTSAAGRLRAIMGIEVTTYLKTFDRANLFRNFPGSTKGGDKFPMDKARLVASSIAPLLSGRTVIMVGRRVAQAFELDQDFHTWNDEWRVARRSFGLDSNTGMCRVAVVPHTSGRNHWYNDGENQRQAKAFWSALLENLG